MLKTQLQMRGEESSQSKIMAGNCESYPQLKSMPLHQNS